MVYIPGQDDDNNEENGQDTGAAGGLVGDAGAPDSGGFKPPTSSGQQFVDIQSYLQANQPQAKQFGENVSKTITDEANTAKSALQSNLYTPEFTQDVVSNFGSYASDPAKADQLKTFAGGFDANQNNYLNLANQANAATEKGNLTTSDSGLKTLSSKFETNPTEGKSSLDALLLGGDPNSKELLAGAKQKTDELNPLLTQVAQGFDQGKADLSNAFLNQGGIKDQFNQALQEAYNTAAGQYKTATGGGEVPFSVANSASADDYAKAALLESLYGDITLLDPSMSDQAGSVPAYFKGLLNLSGGQFQPSLIDYLNAAYAGGKPVV